MTAARVDGLAGHVEFHDVLRPDGGGRDAASEEKPLRVFFMAHADVAEPVHHAFLVQDVIGAHQVVDLSGTTHKSSLAPLSAHVIPSKV